MGYSTKRVEEIGKLVKLIGVDETAKHNAEQNVIVELSQLRSQLESEREANSQLTAENDMLRKDAGRLDAISSEYWALESFCMSAGLDGDADVGWKVLQWHMRESNPRVVAEVYSDDVRAAIDAAMEQTK